MFFCFWIIWCLIQNSFYCSDPKEVKDCLKFDRSSQFSSALFHLEMLSNTYFQSSESYCSVSGRSFSTQYPCSLTHLHLFGEKNVYSDLVEGVFINIRKGNKPFSQSITICGIAYTHIYIIGNYNSSVRITA